MIDKKNVKFYSANGEDYLLWEFFEYKKKGIYIDIGAFDGIHFSNTYSFEKQGWKGVCVEPNPEIYPLLIQNRPLAACLNMACVGDGKINSIDLYCEELGLLSTTFKTSEYESFVEERYNRRGLVYKGLKRVSVPAATIDEVMAGCFAPGVSVDIASIDVEGAELEVLKGFDLNRYNPRVVVIESNNPEQTDALITTFETRYNYMYAGTLVENLFFVKSVAEAKKLRSIQIQCFIEPQKHPRGEQFTPEIYRKGVQLIMEKSRFLKWK